MKKNSEKSGAYSTITIEKLSYYVEYFFTFQNLCHSELGGRGPGIGMSPGTHTYIQVTIWGNFQNLCRILLGKHIRNTLGIH